MGSGSVEAWVGVVIGTVWTGTGASGVRTSAVSVGAEEGAKTAGVWRIVAMCTLVGVVLSSSVRATLGFLTTLGALLELLFWELIDVDGVGEALACMALVPGGAGCGGE